jgi:hypothetical protein
VAWGISLAAWFALDILVQTPTYSYYRERDLAVPWARFIADYCDDVVWAFFTPFILRLIAFAPINRRSWTRTVPFHAMAGLIAGLLWAVPAQASRPGGPLHGRSLAHSGGDGGLRVTSSHGHRLIHSGLRRRTWDPLRPRVPRPGSLGLEAQGTRAGAAQVCACIHPHFLFNTLNTISALIHRTSRRRSHVGAAGRLLRDSFEKIGAHEVSLKQEIDFLDRYLGSSGPGSRTG